MLNKFPINQPFGEKPLEHPKGCRVYTPERDTLFLLWLVSLTSGNVVEIGANEGVTTYHIATTNPGKLIYAIEPATANTTHMIAAQRKEIPQNPFRFCKDLSNVRTIAVDSDGLDYSQMDNVTLVFIDGDHTYEAVKIDSLKALAHLRHSTAPNRFIVWHDYTPNPHIWLGVGAYLHWDLWNQLEIYYVPGTTIAFAKL